MFLVGAVILFREAPQPTRRGRGRRGVRRQGDEAHGAVQAVGASFLVLFAAEWGDLSQLLTLSLVAKYDEPVGVFVGASGALLACQRAGGDRGPGPAQPVRLHVLHYVGASGVPARWPRSTLWEMTR